MSAKRSVCICFSGRHAEILYSVYLCRPVLYKHGGGPGLKCFPFISVCTVDPFVMV